MAAHALPVSAGRFSGTVTDASGGTVGAARVDAVNAETGQKVTETTNHQGQFVLYPLPPGIYDISVQKTGFSAFTISGVRINVSETVVRNVSLELGAMAQSVSVTADAATITTDSPSIQSTITRRQIEASGLRCAGWVANCISPDMPHLDGNIRALEQRLDCPLLGVVPFLREPTTAGVSGLLSFDALIESAT